MRFATSIALLSILTGAVAQFPAAIQNIIGNLSSSCQQTVLSLATGSDFANCIHVSQVLPVITTALTASNSSSIVPYVDQLVGIECNQPGCSNTTLTATWNNITSGCATDLQQYNITNATVRAVFQQYPLARELVCLKTTQPLPANSTSNSTAIPSNSTSNSTKSTSNSTGNGTFCATSLLNGIQSRLGQNISVDFLTGFATSYISGNFNASRYANLFNSSALLCNDCIFAYADVIGVAYPSFGNLTLRQLGLNNTNITLPINGTSANGTSSGSTNGTSVGNTTLSTILNSTCSAQGFTYSSNGTLPSTIQLGAVNSTFGFNLTTSNGTRQAPTNTTAIRRTVADIKARWIGEQIHD